MKISLFKKNTSVALKGILCIFVLLHHLLRVSSLFINSILNILGPLAVGGFFLLSGYGLIVNYKKNRFVYLKKLLFKRIPLTYLMLILTNIFYLILYIFTVSSELSFMNIATSILYLSFSKSFILLYSWIYFLSDLIIYYLSFAIIFILLESITKIKQKAEAGAIIHLISVLTIFILMSIIFQKPLDQRAIFCFSIGIFAGAFEDSISSFCLKNKLLLITVFCTLLILLFRWNNIEFIEEQILPIMFCLLLVVSFNQILFEFKIILFIGKISFYIYLTHGFFFKLFDSIYTLSSFQSFILTTICSIIVSSAIYLLKTHIKSCLKKQSM